MNAVEIGGLIFGIVTCMALFGGAVWKASTSAASARLASESVLRGAEVLAALRIEFAEFKGEIKAFIKTPPEWCERARRECWAECPAREYTDPRGVRPHMPGGA